MSALDQTTARALCEAGYIPPSEYIRLCEENGWSGRDLPPPEPGNPMPLFWAFFATLVGMVVLVWIAYNWSDA